MSEEIFDKQELLEEIDEDWEFLRETVDMLREDGPKLIGKMRAGVNDSDSEAIWQNAHAVKSMVGNFAAAPAFDAAYTIEARGRAGELAGIDTDVDKLEREILRLISALDDLISESGA